MEIKCHAQETETNVPGQGSNPDKSIRSRTQWPGGHVNICILVLDREVLNYIFVSTKKNWNDTITLVK